MADKIYGMQTGPSIKQQSLGEDLLDSCKKVSKNVFVVCGTTVRAAKSKAGPRGSKWMRAPCLTVTHDNSISNLTSFVKIQVVTMTDIEFALFLVNICQ